MQMASSYNGVWVLAVQMVAPIADVKTTCLREDIL